ncbi:CYB2 [Symbiodinium sp. KB8]|nr:CYB2 [Symbiodinium sp. KB8]
MARAALLLPLLWCFLRHAWGLPEGSSDLCAAPVSSEETSLLQASVSGHYFPSSGFAGSDDRKKRKRRGFKIRKGRAAWRKRKWGKRASALPAQPEKPGRWVKGWRGWHFVYAQERAESPSRNHEMIATRTSSKAPVCEAGSFSFSFKNALNDGGSVEGCVRGLECDGIPRPATSVEILSNTQGFGTGDYIKGAKPNTWTLDENCEVVAFNFFSIGAPPSVHKATLFFNSAEDQGASFRAGVASGLNVRTGSIDVSMADVGLKFEQVQ